MKHLLIGACVALLTACGSTENYEAILETWVGASEPELIEIWGPPDRAYKSDDGTKYLTYVEDRSGYVPGTAPSYQTTVIGNTAYTTTYGGSPGYSYSYLCETTFTIVGGRVNSWRWEGNDCKA